MIFCSSCKTNISPAATRTNILWETVVYMHTLNLILIENTFQILPYFIYSTPYAGMYIRAIFFNLLKKKKKLLILNSPKLIQHVGKWLLICLPNSNSIECIVWLLEHFKEFGTIGHNVHEFFFPVKTYIFWLHKNQ